MVDAIGLASSLASGYSASAQQPVQRSQADAQGQAGAAQDAQRQSGAQTRSLQAVQPAAQNDSRDTATARGYASGASSQPAARPDASTGRGQRVDIYA